MKNRGDRRAPNSSLAKGSIRYQWDPQGQLAEWFLEGDAVARVTAEGAIRIETIDTTIGAPAGTLWLKQALPADVRVAVPC